MPFHYQQKLPSLSQVAAGVTASVQLPLGPTYHTITLRYKKANVDATEAQIKADISRVRLKINGVTRFEASGTHIIDLLNKYYGIAFVAGMIVIPLSRPWFKTPESEDNTAWGTRNINSLSLEVDIAAGAGVSLGMEAFADIDPQSRDLGGIIEVHKQDFSTAVSGIYEIRQLATSNGNLVALHAESASITKAEFQINKAVFMDADKAVIDQMLTFTGERSPQAGYTHIDACYRNRLWDTWPISSAQDVMLRLTMSAAGSVPLLMETHSVPLGAAR